MKEREEAWTKVEELAMRNPGYTGLTRTPSTESSCIDSGATSPQGADDDEEMTLEKLEAEARKVSIRVLLYYCRFLDRL